MDSSNLITTIEARKLLGESHSKYSDQEISALVRSMAIISDTIIRSKIGSKINNHIAKSAANLNNIP